MTDVEMLHDVVSIYPAAFAGICEARGCEQPADFIIVCIDDNGGGDLDEHTTSSYCLRDVLDGVRGELNVPVVPTDSSAL